jgi:hypothetical protein
VIENESRVGGTDKLPCPEKGNLIIR